MGNSNWIGGNGNWSDVSNWDTGALPIPFDFVYITSSDAQSRSVLYDYSGSAFFGGVSVDNNGVGTSTLTMSTPGVNLTTSYEAIGESSGPVGSGSFIQSAGINTVQSNELNVGTGAGHVGRYSLSGTGQLYATSGASEAIGLGGVGTFDHSGGTNIVSGTLSVGYGGGRGTYALSGAGELLGGPTESIGADGTGTFAQTGGTNFAGEYLFIGGQNSASNGAYLLSGGSVNAAGGVYLGGGVVSAGTNCNGVLSVSGGQMTVHGVLAIWKVNSTHVDVSGGTLAATSTFNQATINASGGTASLGTLSGTGTLVLSGTALVTASSLQQSSVSVSGSSVLKVTGGSSNSVGSVTVTGTGQVDLTSSKLIITYAANHDPAATILGYLVSGYATGSWSGSGIASSYVAGLVGGTPAQVRSLGWADGADGVVSGLASGQIKIMATLAGDALLLGNVNYADFQILQQNFALPGQWDRGDFNYSGVIDFADFKLLAQDFSNDSALTASQFNAMNSFAGQFGDKLVANANNIGFKLVAIPEPASPVLLVPAALLMVRGGRRSERE